ncbi:MAG TPA: hypothetical protein VGD31_03210 [Sphingobacteriaceae bacterium]
MRRIYLLLFILACIACVCFGTIIGGFGRTDKLVKENYELRIAIQDEKLKRSAEREDELKRDIIDRTKRVWDLEQQVQEKDVKIAQAKASTKKKVEAVQWYTQHQVDTFFQERYFGSDTVFNIDSRKIIADLVGKEGLDATNLLQEQEIGTLKLIVSEQKGIIAGKDSLLSEADFQKAVLNEKIQIGSDLADHYKKQAKKYKRQRNVILTGVSAAVVGGAVIVVKALFAN